MNIRVRLDPAPLLRLVKPGGPSGSPIPPIDLDETQPVLLRRPVPVQRDSPPVRCIRCDGRVERGTAPVLIERPGYRVAWDALPAWVCTRCEMPFFEEREVSLIRQALALLRQAAGTA